MEEKKRQEVGHQKKQDLRAWPWVSGRKALRWSRGDMSTHLETQRMSLQL